MARDKGIGGSGLTRRWNPFKDTDYLPDRKMTVAEVRARVAMQRVPLVIRHWMRKTGARYEPGYGWFIVDMDMGRPVEPPVDWPLPPPMSAAERAARVAKPVSRLLEKYELIPGPARDPADHAVVSWVKAAVSWVTAICRHLLRLPV